MDKYMKLSPEGTRDYLFDECRALSRAESRVCACFERGGFHRVKTPATEFMDIFTAPCVGFAPEELFKLTDRRGRILALRADGTAPVARLVSARLAGQPLPVRLYYNQPVFTVTPMHSAEPCEKTQAGVELVGAPGEDYDLEVLSLGCSVLRLFSGSFRFEIGHIGFFLAIVQDMPLDAQEKEKLRRCVEKRDYSSFYELLESCCDCPQYPLLKALPRLFGGAEVLDRARELYSGVQAGEVLDYLGRVYAALRRLSPQDDIMIDLGLVQRNDYYTGVLFRGYLEDAGEAVLSGGRYDGLLGNFGTAMPSIGFGVNVDQLTRYMLSREKVERPSQVLIYSRPGGAEAALRLRDKLSSQGRASELYIAGSVEEAKAYAAARGITEVFEAKEEECR